MIFRVLGDACQCRSSRAQIVNALPDSRKCIARWMEPQAGAESELVFTPDKVRLMLHNTDYGVVIAVSQAGRLPLHIACEHEANNANTLLLINIYKQSVATPNASVRLDAHHLLSLGSFFENFCSSFLPLRRTSVLLCITPA